MTTHFPRYFKFILIIAAWQTYRVVGAVGWGDLHLSGGDVFPNAWVIPLWQDTATGLLAPLIVFMMAKRPSVLSYALGVSFFIFGIVDFTNGLVVEALYPANVPSNAPSSALTAWLVFNMVLEIVALAFLLTPNIRRYFTEADG
ncbi:hypothetical protein [Thalassobium sp. R2A62]|uniref:hypothetical protein n=1 Tax=Thalassobium sp. R2A62 TaxID=633131 RepID=UPI0001B1D5EC|nr:hypothetical protein [Thalassobium sp. R2A62]EET48604.1 hypothetical protein TR2A62_0210 [Thalassobium sp. R2A62]